MAIFFDRRSVVVTGTTPVLVHTGRVNTSTVINKFTGVNTLADSRLATVYIVPSGSTPDNDNTVVKNKVINALDDAEFFETAQHVLNVGDEIWVALDDVGNVPVLLSYIEVT